jgi:hypothetical protein
MTQMRHDATERRRMAQERLTAAGGAGDARRRLAVRCRCSHRVADVYQADGALVYVAQVTGRGHGRRDRVDEAHRGSAHGRDFVDLLAGDGGDDPLPASCECGPHRLSRATLLAAVAAGDREHLLG